MICFNAHNPPFFPLIAIQIYTHFFLFYISMLSWTQKIFFCKCENNGKKNILFK